MQALFIILMFCAMVFVGILAGTLLGALAGWIVGWFFYDELALLAKAINMAGVEPWRIGAIFGFVGGFFRSSMSTN